MLVDTHAHIHFADSYSDLPVVLENARGNGVSKIITVGTDAKTSQAAIGLAANPTYAAARTGVQIFAATGLHPHNASPEAAEKVIELARQNNDNIVAIGECGLDYYRNNSPREAQIEALEYQIDLAQKLNLPLVFHVREAWDDFFNVLAKHKGIRGVIHSFTGSPAEVKRANELDLYFGLNGIMTFTRDQAQLEAAKLVPADKLLLETDCPYLAPAPLRGKRNEPANLALIAKFLAELRGEALSALAAQATANAQQLFRI